MKLADAHIHLFANGYHRPGLPALFGDRELEAYEALRLTHGIELALVIGYEADGIDPSNNAHIRRLSASRSWLRTLAFADLDAAVDLQRIEQWMDAGHQGLAIYALDRERSDRVLAWPRSCWRALEDRHATVSLNTRPEAIVALGRLIAAWPGVQFLISHLGLPGVIGSETPVQTPAERLAPLLDLARLSNVYVKISGLYATSQPPHAYPHLGADVLIQMILSAFGPARCLWASDFSPALEYVSFPQTVDWPGCETLSESDRCLIYRDNLFRLLSVR